VHGGIEAGNRADGKRRGDAAGGDVPGHDGIPAAVRRVEEGDEGAEDDAGGAAEAGRMSDSVRNWRRMWPLVAPRARPEADLGSPLEDGDDHHVGDADAADEEGYGA
jgi:hypothetical protein